MTLAEIEDRISRSPIIASIHDCNFDEVILSQVEVLFHLKANVNTIAQQIADAHKAGKAIFVHIDLADGIGKDKSGVEYLSKLGVDGIITTRGHIVRVAREAGLAVVQRCFVLDSYGVQNIKDLPNAYPPHFIELMPGVVSKAIRSMAKRNIPVIAGGLIETKQEATEALAAGAVAVSTGKQELWNM